MKIQENQKVNVKIKKKAVSQKFNQLLEGQKNCPIKSN